MEKLLEEESEEQLAADLSELSAWEGSSEGSSCYDEYPCAGSPIYFDTRPTDQGEARRLVMKRKVLRHRPDGTVEVSTILNIKPDKNKACYVGHSRTLKDDSISEEKLETSSSSTLEDYLPDDDDDDWLTDDSPCSLLGDFGSDSISEYSIPRPRPKSYIAPRADGLKRTDPVARLKKYKQEWERFRFPGQDTHQDLRWAVRNQMLQSGLRLRGQKQVVPEHDKA